MNELRAELTEVDAKGLEAQRIDLRALYRTCFAEPPWSETEAQLDGFDDRLATHLAQPGLRAVLAHDEGGRLAGVCYGWPEPDRPALDSPFYAALTAAVTDSLGPGAVSQHLAGALVVVELMVDPGTRRRGLARRLLSSFIGDTSKAWLCTSPAAPAARLYQADGWTPLAEFDSPAGPRLTVYALPG